MSQWEHERKDGYLAAMKQIALNAKREFADEKSQQTFVRAEQTEHRLFALFLTASKLWR